ncbi:MAG TPA: protein kinase [Vicinamibacterales bacterium]
MAAADRWEDVERLYHAALARDDGERASFLREACSGDDALRREVESLLAYDSGVDQFLSTPALEAVRPLFSASRRVRPGQRLGPYEITSLLGTGGMGDVYRARDTKLERDVAIKILPDLFAGDSTRRTRFEREARLLAALNHPHIGAIYGFEERDGIHGLVLELVEGETLAERIRRGALSLGEALAIARQIADALHAAHSKAIVHRDLKPANIALTPEGVVKVLDFGLATSAVAASAENAAAGSIGDSLTHGIAGTAAYMSPEQARGEPADRRADIWAFGCVLWAMLTGSPAFGRETISSTIGAILNREPHWRRLPPTTPTGVARLLQRCLEKDLDRRLGSIAEARFEIDRMLALIADAAADGQPRTRRNLRRLAIGTAAIAPAIALGAGLLLVGSRSSSTTRSDAGFTQITNFTDAAVAPAISPDGRMVAFIRGDRPFLSPDPIYVKTLPDGEAVQVTRDARLKYGIAFSPDGSKIAYTAASKEGWHTFAIPVGGGEQSLVRANAGGLTWLDGRRLLFSAVKTGFHMGIVTANEDRTGYREVYFPQHERSMAHYSYPSPDRLWALVVEMDHRPVWEPCRVVPLDGRSAGRTVGPAGQCSSAGWSPDGRWMYFSVEVDQQFHLWRQRFSGGEPEQLTFGPTQEDGVAVAPDGSIVTSVGMEHSAIWIHDARGDRPLSSEGDIPGPRGFSGLFSLPRFSSDARHVTYLRRDAAGSAAELWRTDVASGASERLLPGIAMQEYDLSPSETEVVFTVQPSGKPSELWVARLDRATAPKRIASTGENAPYFGPSGAILFRFTDGRVNYLGRMNADGSARRKVVEYAIGTPQTISPDRRWLVAITPRLDGSQGAASMAIPTGGGPPRQICRDACRHQWSPDGRLLYVEIEPKSRTSAGRAIALQVSADTGLPDLPDTFIVPGIDPLTIPGSRIVEQAETAPGLDPDTYAYVKASVQRNLFRIAPPSK